MIDFKYSPVEEFNNKQRVLLVPRLLKLKLKRYINYKNQQINSKDVILKRNFIKYNINNESK